MTERLVPRIKKTLTPAEFNATLGRILRRIRTEAGVSQDELADRLEVHTNTISNYERGMGIQTALFHRACMLLHNDPSQVLKEVAGR